MMAASANQRLGRRGFTLLEALVALGIAAMAATVLVAWMHRSRQSALSVDAFSRQLQSELRKARASAIGSNVETVVVFNSRERSFEAQGRRVVVPEQISVEVTAADIEQRHEHAIGIRFFPTGRSTGGVIRISLQSAAQVSEKISINWLTGHVSSQRGMLP
jgi:general secretion pathway protein H